MLRLATRYILILTAHCMPLYMQRYNTLPLSPQDFELDVLEEAYTTEHWIVRIYKVKDLENRGV